MGNKKHVAWSLGGALLVLAALHGHTAPSQPQTVTAQQFRLVDANGNTRALLSCGPDGNPNLVFEDSHGHPRVKVGLEQGENPVVLVNSANGNARAQMLVEADGSLGMVLHDAEGRPRVTLNLSADGNPTFALRDKAGVPRASLEIFKGKPYLNFSDDQTKAAAAMLIGANNEPTILLRDKDGKPLWGAP